ncbi:MAG TPA: benzoate-CoA ligase family protein [Candidatus Dormibacteraeota bacterium]
MDRLNASELLDRNLDAGHGDRVATRCSDEARTYAELHDRAGRIAAALTELGVHREQRVLMVMDDSVDWPAIFLGAIRGGAVPVPVNPLLQAAADYAYFVEDALARAVVTDAPRLALVLEALERVHERPAVILAGPGDAPDGVHRLDALMAAATPLSRPAPTRRDDMAFWLYSSGSTGNPKAVVHLQHDLDYTAATYGREVLGFSDQDLALSTTKLFHAYGLGNSLTFPFSVGASSVVLAGRATPEALLSAVERYRPSLFFSVPTIYNAVLNWAPPRDFDLGSIRLCISAAEQLPAELWQRWKDRFGLVILDGIGSTEMLHIYISNRPDAVRPGSSGLVVPGYETQVLDPEGRPAPAGEAGDLLVKGDSALALYWGQHDKSKNTIRGHWFFSGDRYRIDTDGFHWYEGRSDDMIKVGGLWVSPVEIEGVLIEHPGVLESAVVGVRIDGLTKIKAFVIPRQTDADDALAEELRQWCKSRLQRYKYPQVIEFVPELPKTVTGKVQRFKLRDAPS